MKLYGSILIAMILFQSEVIFCKKKIICYWASGSPNRRGSGQHNIQKINPNLCTHLIYAYAGINSKGNLISLNPTADITNGGYNEFVNLKLKNPRVKILLSIGGVSQKSTAFSEVIRSKKSRTQFISSTIELLNEYNFDGLDIDWEHSTISNGNLMKDRDNFIHLLRELKQKFSKNSKKLILSTAVSSDLKIIKELYNIKSICSNVNFINLKTYDMNHSNVTSFNAPLRKIKGDFKEKNYIKQIVNHFVEHDCSVKKIILGIPAYGRTYTLKTADKHELGDLVNGLGPKGPYTNKDGLIGYNEICLYQRRQLGWEQKISKWKAQIYAWRFKFWFSYDSPLTVRIKAKYVQRKDLGGIMFWSIDTDDFEGICSDVKYPLIKAAKKVLWKNPNEDKID